MCQSRIGVCPIESSAIVRYMLRIARKRAILTKDAESCVNQLVPFLPSNYLPDICLEFPLVEPDANPPRAALVLDSYDYNYLAYASGNAWPAGKAGVALPEPGKDGRLVGIVASAEGVRSAAWDDDARGRAVVAPAKLAEAAEALERLGLCVRVVGGLEPSSEACPHDGEPLGESCDSPVAPSRCELVAILPRAGIQHRLANNPHKGELFGLLRSLGLSEERLDALARASVLFGVPYYDASTGYQELVAMLDVSHISLVWKQDVLVDARAGIVLSDKIMGYAGRSLKPGRAYQWHITDECDQRCKHCYLFGEDARMACVTTPWDQLMATLDQIESRCAASHCYPTLAISGGDPLLHPRFWDLAEEFCRRGISWTAMGNPFHLDLEACLRLKRLGCLQYQMSLDGLREFHDSLRKPGSYDATLAALAPLQQAGIETQLMATASKQNLDDILACMDVVASHGVSSFSFARYCATSPQKADELYPTPEEYRAFLLAYWEKKQAYEQMGCKTVFKTKEHLFTLLRWELGDLELPALPKGSSSVVHGGCHLGSKATICANGDLLACRRMPSVVGNIRSDTLWDAEHSEAMLRYVEVSHIEKCRDCELLAWCRGCRAVGVNATGNLQAADPMCWK